MVLKLNSGKHRYTVFSFFIVQIASKIDLSFALFTFIIYLSALTIYLYYVIIIISKFATARLKNGYFE